MITGRSCGGAPLHRPFVLRYVAALGLIAVLSVAAHLTLEQLVSQQKSAAAQINVAGRQRMLSQRAALGAEMLVDRPSGGSPDVGRQVLTSALDRLETEHRALRTGDASLGLPVPEPGDVARRYSGPGGVDEQLAAFVADGRALAAARSVPADDPALTRMQDAAVGPLLASLDTVVTGYQSESGTGVGRIIHESRVMLLITLLVLVGEAGLVFHPMARRIRRETERLRQAEADQRYAAEHDSLTDLFTRRFVTASVSALPPGPFAAALLDLDHFKALNDGHGHDVGDRVLVCLARVLERQAPEDALVGRQGGEEFVVVLPGGTAADLVDMASKVREALCDACCAADLPLVTASWGVTDAVPGTSWGATLRAADDALFEAKRAGRDRVRVANAGALSALPGQRTG